MSNQTKFSPEVRERAVRLVQEHRGEYPSLWAAVQSIAPKIGCVPTTLLDWVKRSEIDSGIRDGITTSGRERMKALEREVWHQLQREGIAVARCTVEERLMRRLGLQGVRRGKRVRTTIADRAQACPLDRVNRHFHADRPNQLWVSDFTYVSTWQGWLYVAFIIDVFARRIVGWRVSNTMSTDFVLDALEQALYDRRPTEPLTHHSDRGSQGVFNRSSQHWAVGWIVDARSRFQPESSNQAFSEA